MFREPLLLPAVALAAGILTIHFTHFEGLPLLVTAIVSGLLCLAALAVGQLRRFALLPICGLVFVTGAAVELRHEGLKTPLLDAVDSDTVLLDGCVVNPPVFSPGREQMTVALGRRARIRLSVALKGDAKLPLNYGQRIEVASKVRRPRNFGNPDAFNYVEYLANQHIYWTGSVSSPADIHVLPGTCGYRAIGWLYGLRTWALNRLQALYPDDQHTLGLLQATLLGETSGTERRWTNEFRVTGTYHAIVISGLHVWILSTAVLLILNVFQFKRLPALFVATVVSWIYAFLAGGNAPVMRAAGGFTLFLIASFLFRRTRILNLVAAVGIVYLLVAPEQLFDPAFQLSFLSAAAIAGFAIPLIERYVHPLQQAIVRMDQVRYDPMVPMQAAPWRVEFRLLAETVSVWSGLGLHKAQIAVKCGVKLFAFAAEMVLVSACVQFGLALPMISYFHRLSVTGLSANILVVPLLTVVVPAGFAAILTGWHWVAGLAALFLHWAEAIAVWHMGWEPAWRIGAVPLQISLAFCAALVALGVVVRHARRLVPTVLAAALLLFTVICLQPWKALVHQGELEVTAIDVSQGDSLLVVFPNGKTMLMDAGGVPGMERMAHKPNLDFGEDVVSPYLWSRRIRHLDYAALSHGHSDHMAGMPAVLDNFRPATMLTGAEPESREWDELVQHAKADQVSIQHLVRGCPDMEIGGARVHVLAPAADYLPAETAKNDDSLVLQITYGKRSVLLTGDAERPVEESMVQSGELRPVTLLKVGHHGSRTSSSEEFLSQINPQFAFISDGYLNQFHHPHQVVLDRLKQHHTAIYRTDERGLLTFRTDGDTVKIEPFH